MAAPVNTLRKVVTSALFTLGKPTDGKEYAWLEWQAIKYFSSYAPLDGNVKLKVMYSDLGTTARIFTLPPDCMRISRVALRSGTRMWTLTLDTNLRIPEELFTCTDDANDTSSNFVYNAFWPAWAVGAPNYSLAGGRNTNYYRIDGNNIIFDHNVPAGELVVEYLSNGNDVNENTMIDAVYFAPIENWLMAQWVFHRGSGSEKQKYSTLIANYDSLQWNARALVDSVRIYEMIDAINQSSGPNYA